VTDENSTPHGRGPDANSGSNSLEAEIRCLVLGSFQANCYLVTCPETRETVVIDPGAEAERILQAVEDASTDDTAARVVAVIATHGHVDHVGAAGAVREKTGAPVLVHAADAPMLKSPVMNLSALLPGGAGAGRIEPDRALTDGERIAFGRLALEVRHSPGHSPGGICLVLEREPEPPVCFSGDTLFAGSVGRTDLPGGDWTILEDSIRKVIYSLPDRTVVLPGHGPETTVGREKRTNPFVGW